MERIPVLQERLDALRAGQLELKEAVRLEIHDLKHEHILEIRKNICRIWMAIDDLRMVKNKVIGAFSFLNLVFSILGGVVGVLGTMMVFKH